MIDWPTTLANATWLCGAALALAVFSYAHWLATAQQQPLRTVVRRPAFYRAWLGAAVLFCFGLGMTANSLIETVIWLGLALASLVNLILHWRLKPIP